MKHQVEAGIEPWATSFALLKENSFASYNYTVNGSPDVTVFSRDEPYNNYNTFKNDGLAAYYNALMWSITGDARHADKCVEIFNAWSNIKRVEADFALDCGRVMWKILEGAEIIKSTYSGWSATDIKRFQDMLVYPGYSGTSEPSAAMNSNDASFYWYMYNGDPARHGNQGLFAMRGVMAIGIFTDNEIMYQRALRYLQGLPHRPDDLPYPSGPPVTSGKQSSSNEYYDEFKQYSRSNTIEDYGYNEVMEHYIWENGQGQESSRDQGHGLGGVSIINTLCEMSWNQGDDLYGHLDNRLLLGLEFYLRYNLSYESAYSDQLSPWEPTLESDEFIQRTDRSGRWKSLKMNPWRGNDLSRWTRGTQNNEPIYEISLGHYKDRMNLNASKTKWLERGFDIMSKAMGVEQRGYDVDHTGWGGLTFRRVSPGDPTMGFSSGIPTLGMHVLPGILAAENYDYFAINGEGHTYHDADTVNTGGKYRLDEGVDIDSCSEGGYCLSYLENGEWLTYTVFVPNTALYKLSIRYASAKINGKIKLSAADVDKSGEVAIPFGEGFSTGLNDWQDLVIAEDIILSKGVQAMKVWIGGESNAFHLNEIKIEIGSEHGCENGLPELSTVSYIKPGIRYAYYQGSFDSIPDFSTLTATEVGFADSIRVLSHLSTDTFAMEFTGHIDIPINGNFTFYTLSDEGSRLYIDGTLLVDNNGLHTAMEQSASICLDEGFHDIKVEYFENRGTEELTVLYKGPGLSKRKLENLYAAEECENAAIEVPDNITSGINYYYYEGSWTMLPDFSTLSEKDRGTISAISLGSAQQADYYAFVFEAYMEIEEDGDYTFYTSSDDGSALYIDGERVVNNDGTHGVEEAAGSLCLAKGYHQIRIEFFENSGGSSLSVKYEGGGLSKRKLTNLYCVAIPAKASQTVAMEDIAEKNVGDPDFTPGAIASSGLPITYSTYNAKIASIVNNKVHIVGEGKVIIVATQEGDAAYKSAKISKWLTVNPLGTSMETNLIPNALLYPNPVSDVLYIQRAESNKAKLVIYNSLGKVVHTQEIEGDKASVSTNNLADGIFLVRISGEKNVSSQQIVIRNRNK